MVSSAGVQNYIPPNPRKRRWVMGITYAPRTHLDKIPLSLHNDMNIFPRHVLGIAPNLRLLNLPLAVLEIVSFLNTWKADNFVKSSAELFNRLIDSNSD